MIRVVTGSRLHFGLIAPASVEEESRAGRIFGGAGLMVEQPGIILELVAADAWSCQGLLAERLEVELRSLLGEYDWVFRTLPPHCVRILQATPEHIGLGTGTQLALALASALIEAVPHFGLDFYRLTHRGCRSAIGYHGFHQGGFLVDGGKQIYKGRPGIAALVTRHEFPAHWPIVLFTPRTAKGRHGETERQAFAGLGRLDSSFRDVQCARLLLDVLPALVENDVSAFSEALHQYNRAAGEPFRSLQGGPYSSPDVERLIEKIRGLGISGAGQSSWGPTVFAITQDEQQAEWLVDQLRLDATLGDHDMLITRGQNHGAVVTRG